MFHNIQPRDYKTFFKQKYGKAKRDKTVNNENLSLNFNYSAKWRHLLLAIQ